MTELLSACEALEESFAVAPSVVTAHDGKNPQLLLNFKHAYFRLITHGLCQFYALGSRSKCSAAQHSAAAFGAVTAVCRLCSHPRLSLRPLPQV